MKKLLLSVLAGIVLLAPECQASQTHTYYNETGHPVQITTTYAQSIQTKQSRPSAQCNTTTITIKGPSEQMPKPWAIRRPESHCAIVKVEATVKKENQEMQPAAQPFTSRSGVQGAAKFYVQETELGSNKYKVIKDGGDK